MRAAKRLFHWMIAGTAGGVNRGRILQALIEKPRNANALANDLHLDYKTIQHHLKMLKKNQLILTQGSGYGVVYFPSGIVEENIEDFYSVWNKIGKNDLNKKE